MKNLKTLGEHALHIAMGPFGSSVKRSTFVDKGIPIISGAHLHKAKLDESDGFNFITEEHANRHQNSIVKKGDVVFTAYGTIGQVSFVPENSKYDTYIASQRQFFLRPDPGVLDPIFLTYYFRSREGRHLLLSNSSQVGVPSIASPTSFLKSLEIPIPSINRQKVVAHILGTLDDKIELNRKTNKTLEGIAKALFKSWFVDFDPVRAKAEGRPTGLPDEISELFPDSLEESELGEIPCGWSTSSLGDSIHWIHGKTWAKELRVSASDITSLGSNGVMGFSTEAMGKDRIIVMGNRGSCGALNFFNGKYWVTNNAYFLRQSDHEFFEFTRAVVTSIDFSPYVGGSSNPFMPLKNFSHILYVLPPERVIHSFNTLAEVIRGRVECFEQEILVLEKLRDALLPRLISGELRVPEAEKMLKEAGI